MELGGRSKGAVPSQYAVRGNSCPRKFAGQIIIRIDMHQKRTERVVDLNPQETQEWLESLEQVIDEAGPDRARFLLEHLSERARNSGAELPILLNTPYVNTIRADDEEPYPGDRALERHGDGGPAEQVRPRDWRPHFDVCVAGHAARSRLQPFFPRAIWRSTRR